MSMYPQQDQGLRKPWELEYANDNKAVSNFFNMVYAWMAVGLAVTAACAWFGSQHIHQLAAIGKGGLIVMGLAAFGISMLVQASAGRMQANVATVLFLIYAAIIGFLLSGIFLVYSP